MKYRVVRYLAYSIELLIVSMLQQTPGLFPEVSGARPVLLIPAVLSIALLESEMASMAFGIAGGLLIDFACGTTLGFHALMLALLCYLLSSAASNLLRVNLFTMLLTGAVSIAAVVVLEWVFYYLAVGYDYPGYVLMHHYLSRFIYTFVFIIPAYYLNRSFAILIRSPEE